MRPFTDVLREIRKGRVVDRATELLAEIVQAVDETDKPGTLTLTLTVKPEKGGGRQKVISAKLTSKRPEDDLPEAIFYSTDDGDLVRSDPDQGGLFDEAELGDAPGPRSRQVAERLAAEASAGRRD